MKQHGYHQEPTFSYRFDSKNEPFAPVYMNCDMKIIMNMPIDSYEILFTFNKYNVKQVVADKFYAVTTCTNGNNAQK
jgi:hypothetical protein